MNDGEMSKATEVPIVSHELESIKSLNETKKEIFKILADKEIDQQLKDAMLNHLIEIDKGLIERISNSPRSIFEIKTYNKVIEGNHTLRKIHKVLKKLLSKHKDNEE